MLFVIKTIQKSTPRVFNSHPSLSELISRYCTVDKEERLEDKEKESMEIKVF